MLYVNKYIYTSYFQNPKFVLMDSHSLLFQVTQKVQGTYFGMPAVDLIIYLGNM